ncbi:MAG: hypothetical protein IJY23_03245 [Clostridia bacterium]|nr:hypothetical protein [Clostridia bacterium]
MALALIYLFASLLIFLILTEVITVRIVRGDESFFDVNLTLFAIRLTPIKNNDTKKSKKKSKKSNIRSALILEILRKSKIVVREFKLTIPEKDPANNAFRGGVYTSVLSSIIAYAEENVAFFHADNIIIDYSAHNELKTTLDADITVRLSSVIGCVFVFLFESVVNKLKQKRGSYGRKQNE